MSNWHWHLLSLYQFLSRALLVDEFAHYKILANDSKNVRLTGMSQRRINKVGMVGWNPLHDILHPTIESVGAYDYFREDVFYEQDVNCHLPINPKFYVVEPYPDSGNLIRQVDEQNAKEHCYRLNNTYPEDPLPAADNIGFCMKMIYSYILFKINFKLG